VIMWFQFRFGVDLFSCWLVVVVVCFLGGVVCGGGWFVVLLVVGGCGGWVLFWGFVRLCIVVLV